MSGSREIAFSNRKLTHHQTRDGYLLAISRFPYVRARNLSALASFRAETVDPFQTFEIALLLDPSLYASLAFLQLASNFGSYCAITRPLLAIIPQLWK